MSKRKWIIVLLLMTFAVLSPNGTVYGEEAVEYSITGYKSKLHCILMVQYTLMNILLIVCFRKGLS